MCNQSEPKESCACIKEILKTILCLQNKKEQLQDLSGCDKPFLGPCPSAVCFNTRPIQFYCCCNGRQFAFPYRLNGSTGTSSIFRVESLDGCCCTCRILTANPNPTAESPYVATESYVTLNLDCVSAIHCLADTYVPCI